MDLAKHIAARIEKADAGRAPMRRRLRGVPSAVVEEIARMTLDEIGEATPNGVTLADLLGDDIEACEACGVFVVRGAAGIAFDAEEGIHLCSECAKAPMLTDASAAAPSLEASP